MQLDPGSWPIAGKTPWDRRAVAAWTVILCVVCSRPFLTNCPSLYPTYLLAGHNWFDGKNLYHQPGEPFRYSPLVATFFVPFAFCPQKLGSVLWRLLNAGVFLGGLAYWSASFLPESWGKNQRGLLYILVLPLSVGSLSNAQSNALLIGLLLIAVAAVSAQRWNVSALCVVLACALKVYPIALGLLLVLAFPRQYLFRLLLGLMTVLILPYCVQKPAYVTAQYKDWVNELRLDDRQSWPLDESYREIRLLCRCWWQPLSARAYLSIQILAALGLAAACLAIRRMKSSGDGFSLLIFHLACCWMTVLGPATESCTYILLAPTLAWTVIWCFRTSNSRLAQGFLVASYSLFLSAQVALWFPGGKHFGSWGPQPLGGCLLFSYLIGATLIDLTRRYKGVLSVAKSCSTQQLRHLEVQGGAL